MQIDHPKLEGKYLLFEYTECDREAEGTGLSLYRLVDGKLETIISSAALFEPSGYGYNSVSDPRSSQLVTPTDYVVSSLVGLGVKKVFSVMFHEDFYHIPFGCRCDEDIVNEDGECESWYEFSYPTEDSECYDLLCASGIELKFYDPKKRQFFK